MEYLMEYLLGVGVPIGSRWGKGKEESGTRVFLKCYSKCLM
jgi:hypothetical protein